MIVYMPPDPGYKGSYRDALAHPSEPEKWKMETLYTITNLDGSNPRQVTVAQYKALVREAARKAQAIFARDAASIKAGR